MHKITDEKMSPAVEYRIIERFAGYQFGSDGSVWSEWRRRGTLVHSRTGEWHRLYPHLTAKGYPRMSIRIGPRKFKDIFVHSLILEAFRGPCPAGCEARHYPNRDRACISIDNLSWATRSRNFQDKWEHGTMRHGEAHHNAKLTADKVREIRRRFAAGETQVAMAKEFGVRQCVVSDVVLRKTWVTVQ